VRVTRSQHGLTVHLINLTDQDESGWDAPKHKIKPIGDLTLRLRKVEAEPTGVFWADPDSPGPMAQLASCDDGLTATYALPLCQAWSLLYIPFDERP